MYRVLLERGAEKDLSRLTSEIHQRIIAPIQALARNPDLFPRIHHSWQDFYRHLAPTFSVWFVKPNSPFFSVLLRDLCDTLRESLCIGPRCS
jgi:hypothetical protein